MDEADLAQISSDYFLRRSLAAHQSGSDMETSSASECEGCGEPIPEPRRRAVPGCRLCVKCQTELETRR